MKKKLLVLMLSASMVLSSFSGFTRAGAAETDATEPPATEADATEAPTSDADATEVPATEAPTSDADATDAPVTEAPTSDADATDAPATTEPDDSPAPSETPAPTTPPVANTDSFNPNDKDPFTKTKYDHGTVADGKSIYVGIDVSHHQAEIDWEKVRKAGVQFAIIRAGYRGSAGGLNTDRYFKQNIEGAHAAGIPIGIYFYSIAITKAEAKAEANYCINLLKDYKDMVSLPVAIDYEDRTERMVNAQLSKSKAAKICEQFCETVKAEGYTPMVYSYLSYFKNYLNGEYLSQKYKIWYAHYNNRVGLASDNYKTYIDGDYEFWQYSSKGKVNGISGNVDCNFWYTSDNMNSVINSTKITKATLAAIPDKTYTGKAIQPGVTLTYNNKTLKNNTDYTVSYSNNTMIGKATVTIKGKGSFYGTRTKTFKILPKKVTSFKKKAGTKRITLSWKKNANATGYIIYRKTTYNATTYKKVKTIKAQKTTTWLNTKLKADREYFYSIRAYTTVGTAKYYSNYTYLAAPTLPGSKKAVLNKSLKLYQEPALTGASLVKIPKKAKVTYLGRTYTSGANFVYHVTYVQSGKTYTGYIKNTAKFIY